jgi:hypothetical protein
LQLAEALADGGFRVLGVCCKPPPAALDHARVDDEAQLAFEGLVAMEEPPKACAAAAVRGLHAAAAASLPYLPWLPPATMFGFTSLPLRWLGWLAVLVTAFLTLATWLKPLAWRGFRRAPT